MSEALLKFEPGQLLDARAVHGKSCRAMLGFEASTAVIKFFSHVNKIFA
jgi:hypothetical protein